MNAKSTLMPPCGAEKLPSIDFYQSVFRLFIVDLRWFALTEPPEYGIIGMRYLWQTFAIIETSSVDFGYATATGNLSIL